METPHPLDCVCLTCVGHYARDRDVPLEDTPCGVEQAPDLAHLQEPVDEFFLRVSFREFATLFEANLITLTTTYSVGGIGGPGVPEHTTPTAWGVPLRAFPKGTKRLARPRNVKELQIAAGKVLAKEYLRP